MQIQRVLEQCVAHFSHTIGMAARSSCGACVFSFFFYGAENRHVPNLFELRSMSATAADSAAPSSGGAPGSGAALNSSAAITASTIAGAPLRRNSSNKSAEKRRAITLEPPPAHHVGACALRATGPTCSSHGPGGECPLHASSTFCTHRNKKPTRASGSMLFKTQMCRLFEQGGCPFGHKCNFAHGPEELRCVQNDGRFQTRPCDVYGQTGHCRHGLNCFFKHEFKPACARHPPDECAALRCGSIHGAHAGSDQSMHTGLPGVNICGMRDSAQACCCGTNRCGSTASRGRQRAADRCEAGRAPSENCAQTIGRRTGGSSPVQSSMQAAAAQCGFHIGWYGPCGCVAVDPPEAPACGNPRHISFLKPHDE
jgi:hypothetical protein